MSALTATDSQNETWMPAAGFDGLVMNANANSMPAAQAFLTFISSPGSMESHAAVDGSLPAVAGESFEPDVKLSVAHDYWTSGRTYPFPDQLWLNPAIASAHKEGIQEVFGGQPAIEEVLSNMTAACFTQ
jgi:ABC-type glycerol-3-phosphate transport system substrate-binding protein